MCASAGAIPPPTHPRWQCQQTGEMEHKQTLMTREQHMNVDDKAAPGRLRYRHGSRMAIISEDDESETGFWHGAVYQYHRTANVGRVP